LPVLYAASCGATLEVAHVVALHPVA